jgi:hypothetical protein|tara:strand:+ start:1421 stop:1636 length:216 start_codon:yes stop_codon:yes gene_type:complete
MDESQQETVKQVLDELPVLLVMHAYRKLKSGEDLTASEMKVCLDVCKQYTDPEIVQKAQNILDDLPFDHDE